MADRTRVRATVHRAGTRRRSRTRAGQPRTHGPSAGQRPCATARRSRSSGARFWRSGTVAGWSCAHGPSARQRLRTITERPYRTRTQQRTTPSTRRPWAYGPSRWQRSGWPPMAKRSHGPSARRRRRAMASRSCAHGAGAQRRSDTVTERRHRAHTQQRPKPPTGRPRVYRPSRRQQSSRGVAERARARAAAHRAGTG